MKVIYGINKIKKFKRPVVALGVFDGVHLGHRRILEEAVCKARLIKGTSIVITFWPHPQGEESLYSLEHRLRLLKELSIDICIVIKFSKAFSRISAQDFVKDILVEKIGVQYVYVGKNFRFGRFAKGDWRLLKNLSDVYNFKLRIFDVIKIAHHAISSTYIRRLITNGDLGRAQKLLTRPVSVLGTVIKGVSLGHRLGFPTANINPHHEVIPPQGVYAVRIIFNREEFNGVCYIGTRPTFTAQYIIHNTQSLNNIEVYIFNFNKNIYGRYLEIQFIKKIRNERKFNNSSALAAQIKKDLFATQNYFPSIN